MSHREPGKAPKRSGGGAIDEVSAKCVGYAPILTHLHGGEVGSHIIFTGPILQRSRLRPGHGQGLVWVTQTSKW